MVQSMKHLQRRRLTLYKVRPTLHLMSMTKARVGNRCHLLHPFLHITHLTMSSQEKEKKNHHASFLDFSRTFFFSLISCSTAAQKCASGSKETNQ